MRARLESSSEAFRSAPSAASSRAGLVLSLGVLSLLSLAPRAEASCAAPPTGLVDWWRAEGNANDSVGTINGTLYNGTTFAGGEVGQAFSFNGTNNSVTNATPGITNILDSYTMEFWAFPAAARASTPESTSGLAGTSGQRYAIFPNFGGSTLAGAGVSVGTNGVSVFEHGNTYLPSLLVYDAAIIGWTHVAVVYQGRQPNLYLNGTLVRTGLPSTRSSYPSTWLGESGPLALNYGFYAGLLDEVSIYNRSLSASEVQSIYNAGVAGKCAGPIAPTILSQPANQTTVVGGAAMFTVSASGTAPLAYQWSLNGTNLAAATNSSLLLTNIQSSQAGNYAVLVTNSVGAALSSNALLTVNPAPPCAGPPAGLVNWWRAEANANDSVGNVNGSLYNGTGFSPGQVGLAFSFDGFSNCVTNPTPGITNVLDSYTMEFWAYPTAGRASTPEGTSGVTGNSAQRYAIFPLNSSSGAAGAGVSVGTNGVSVFEHAPFYLPSLLVYDAPIVGWTHVAVVYQNRQPSLYLNGTLVRVGLSSGTASFPSTFLGENGAQSLNYGFYSGLLDEVSIYNRPLSPFEIQSLYNADGAGKCTAAAPSIVSQPTNQTVVVSHAAAFTVVGAGTPPLSYQWSFNGTNLAGATSSSLTLTNVQFAQAGNYMVQVTNGYGSLFSSNALLVVTPPACVTPPAGLVNWWRAEGNADDSADSLNGTLYNGTSFATGKVGQAFSFNGTSNSVTNSMPGLTNIVDSFTMEFWAFPTAARAGTPESTSGLAGTSNQRYAIFPNFGGATRAGAGVSVGTNGVSVFEHGDTYLPSLLVYNAPIVGWTHVAVVYTNRQPRLYLNGTLVRTGLTSTRSPYPSTWLGESGPLALNYGFYAGLLDEVSIYNRALSASEVQSLYNADTAGKCVNHPPTASNLAAATRRNQAISIPAEKILLYASDPDGDPLVVTNVSATSTNGGSVVLGGGAVTYTPVAGFIGADRFTYTVADGRGGTASAFVLVQVRSDGGLSQNMLPLTTTPNGYLVTFAGIPGRTYTLQRAPSVTGPWTTLASVTAGADGLGSYEDTNPPPGSAFYRTVYP